MVFGGVSKRDESPVDGGLGNPISESEVLAAVEVDGRGQAGQPATPPSAKVSRRVLYTVSSLSSSRAEQRQEQVDRGRVGPPQNSGRRGALVAEDPPPGRGDHAGGGIRSRTGRAPRSVARAARRRRA